MSTPPLGKTCSSIFAMRLTALFSALPHTVDHCKLVGTNTKCMPLIQLLASQSAPRSLTKFSPNTNMKSIQLITETRDFYSADPSRRARKGLSCLYSDPESGNQCAVGRCMTPGPWREFIGDFDEVRKNFNLSEVIRPEYYNIPTDLWTALQDWHDSDQNFSSTGLTERGETLINNLIDCYK